MRTAAIGLPLLLAALPARADYVLTQRRTPPGGGECRQVLYLAKGAAKLVSGHEVTIVRLDTGVIWRLDTILKTYDEHAYARRAAESRRVNKGILEALRGAPDGARKSEMIDSLTDGPEKREHIWQIEDERLRRSLAAKYGIPERKPAVEVREKEGKRTVAGLECEEVEVRSNGVLFFRAWVTRGLKLDARLFEFLERAGMVPKELAVRMRKERAFPREIETPLREGVARTVTLSIEEKRLPRKEFELPRRYRKSRRKDWSP